jgi:hypothetical protein
MAGESIRDYGSWVDLEANGGTIANNAFGEANDASFSLATDGGNRPHLEFEIEVAFATAPTANTVLALHHVDRQMFGGANHGRDPSANQLGGYLCTAIQLENTTATQRARFDLMFAPTEARYWLQNVATGQTVSAGWRLRARSWSLKAA